VADSAKPEFWNERYAKGRIPWDFGGVPVELLQFLSREKPGSVLIPGCGTGYEVCAFARAGWQVDAVDFSREAICHARRVLGEDARFVRQADFFAENPSGSCDLVYERTFLCSFPKTLWPSYVTQITKTLRTGGCLAGFFFFGPEPEPPPYPLAAGELAELLGKQFTQIENAMVSDSLPFFRDKEKWQVWRKL
jgi:SAM-dependent methyltransferase